MKVKEAAVDIFADNQTKTVTINLYCRTSSTLFAEVVLTADQWVQALGRLSMTDAQIHVAGLDKINKTLEVDKHEFPITDDLSRYHRDEEKLYQLAVATCPAGWRPDNYFGSQDSFFKKGDQPMARVTIRRWVEEERLDPDKIAFIKSIPSGYEVMNLAHGYYKAVNRYRKGQLTDAARDVIKKNVEKEFGDRIRTVTYSEDVRTINLQLNPRREA